MKEFEPIGRKAKIILYGSVAKGNYRLDSDIDLAIVTKDEKVKKNATQIANKILAKYGKLVSLVFLSPEDLRKSKPFIKEVLKGKVIYSGRS